MNDSDSEELLENSWSFSKRKKKIITSSEASSTHLQPEYDADKLSERLKKFEELKAKHSDIMLGSSLRRQKTEARRSKKLVKKALKDPWVKEAVDSGQNSLSKEEEKRQNEENWDSVKPFLFVNKHMQGPVSHGDFAPKTELECQIEDCIREGDLEKAELLSDTLANRQFAVEIAKAFDAKKYKEKQDEKKALEGNKKRKKLRWTFDAKERWQMKGNM